MTLEQDLKKLTSGDYDPGHVLGYDKFSDKDAQLLAEALKSGKCPKHLQIDLRDTDISDEAVKALASVLASGKFSPVSSLWLCGTKIGVEGIKALASALESGNCPEGFSLTLSNNDIGVEGVKALASALESGNCPERFSLDLCQIYMGYKGVQPLAKALASGQCPKGFFLDLSYNYFGDEGAEALALALETGRGPANLVLDLQHADIGDKGAKALASSLQSGNCPSGYRLCLGDTGDPEVDSVFISDAGADAFVTALASGKYRTGFRLEIDCPGIRERQDEKFAEVLSSGSCPYGTYVSSIRSYRASSRSNNNRINAEKGRALATIIGRYEGMNETKKIKDANDNVTKSRFNLLPDAIFQVIASFLPGIVKAEKVRGVIKLASEMACKKIFRESIESTIREFVRKNTSKIFNDASTSFNRRSDVPHLFFNNFLPTYESFKLTNVSAEIIDENEDNNDNSDISISKLN